MKLTYKKIIRTGKLKYFGEQLIKTDLIETSEQKLKIPAKISFNHSWEFSHTCSSCNKPIILRQDFDNNFINFSVINNINSINYEHTVLQDICTLFSKIKCVDIDGVFYLNRTDFDYTFDFQKKTSVELTSYSCENCGANYLALMRIGIPLLPEKNAPFGKLGCLEINQIFEMNEHLNEFLR